MDKFSKDVCSHLNGVYEQKKHSSMKELKQAWLDASFAEKSAKQTRLDIEKSMIELAGDLPHAGTTKLENGVKVVTGMSTTYNQDELMELYRSGEVSESEWPFEKTFKPVSADLSYLQKNKPEVFNKIDACAVTKPKKPAFKVEG